MFAGQSAGDVAAQGRQTEQLSGTGGGPGVQLRRRDYGGALRHLAAISHEEPGEQELADRFAGVVAVTLEADCVELLECGGDRETLTLRAHVGLPGVSAGQAEVPGGLGTQAGYTILKGAPEVLRDDRDGSRSYEISGVLAGAGVRSGVTVPIPRAGRAEGAAEGAGDVPRGISSGALGVLGAYSRWPREYAAGEVAFLTEAARYLAGGMRRQREDSRRRVAQRWLRVMEEAAILGVSATDRASTLASFARFLSCGRVGIADLCFIDLERAGGEGIVREAAARGGAPLATVSGSRPLLYPPDPGCPHGTPAVLDTGQPHTITAVEREHLECLARDEAHLNAFVALEPVSFMCLPIKAHRHTLGALVLISCDHPYTRDDERHAGRLAYIIGMSIEATNARMQRLQTTRQQVDNYFPSTSSGLEKDPLPQLEPAALPEPQPQETANTPIPPAGGVLPETQDTTESLTNREVEVLTLANQGLSLPKIIATLAISKWTCYTHFRNAKLKLNLPTDTPTAALVSVARDLGYIKR